MDAEMLSIDTDGSAADALAWLTLVGASFDDHTRVALRPHLRQPRAATAVTGIGAIALRTNDAGVLLRHGADVLVGPAGHSSDQLRRELDEQCPATLSVLWDSPAWELARRHGLKFRRPPISPDDHLRLNALSMVRARALHHTMPLHLVSESTQAEFLVRVLSPGWAVLEAIAQHREFALLADAGAIDPGQAVRQFRVAAGTLVRAYRAFPDACTSLFSEIRNPRGAVDDVLDSSWNDFLADTVQHFVVTGSTRKALLLNLEDGLASRDATRQYHEHRALLQMLGRHAGVWSSFEALSRQQPLLGNS